MGLLVFLSEENIFSQADPICSVPARSYTLLGGSWDLVNKVISTLIGVTSNYKYSYLNYNPSY